MPHGNIRRVSVEESTPPVQSTSLFVYDARIVSAEIGKMMRTLYDEDVVLWSEQQAAALRRATQAGSNLPIDWENVAEEIDSLGRSQRTALASQLQRILQHLMKLQASPATDPRRGWAETILQARGEIEDLLEDSPSLRREIPELIARELPKARKRVRDALALYEERPTVELDGLTYSEHDVTERLLNR